MKDIATAVKSREKPDDSLLYKVYEGPDGNRGVPLPQRPEPGAPVALVNTSSGGHGPAKGLYPTSQQGLYHVWAPFEGRLSAWPHLYEPLPLKEAQALASRLAAEQYENISILPHPHSFPAGGIAVSARSNRATPAVLDYEDMFIAVVISGTYMHEAQLYACATRAEAQDLVDKSSSVFWGAVSGRWVPKPRSFPKERVSTITLSQCASLNWRSNWDIRGGVSKDMNSLADAMAVVGNMQLRYAHFPSGKDGEHIVDMFTGATYSVKAFSHLMMRHNITIPSDEVYASGARVGQPKPPTQMNVVQVFLSNDETIVIDGYRFDPNTEAHLIEVEGQRFINFYSAPTFLPGDAERVDWFLTFMEHLIPDERERWFTINWIAHKVQNPGARGVAVVFGTPAFGTGRNVLFKIVRALLGSKWCSDVNASVLLGTSGQSQYDDVFLNRVLVTCDEIAMQGSDWGPRMAAFERLKSVFDPHPQHRTLNRKGLSVVAGDVYYSGLMATNQPNGSLPLMPGDRRFAIIDCTREPVARDEVVLKPEIKRIIDNVLPHGEAPNATMIADLHAYLSGLETDAEAFFTVPETLARQTLIEDGEGEVEKMIRRFLSKLPEEQGVFWFSDLVQRCEQWLSDKVPVKNGFEKNARTLLRNGFAGWTYPNEYLRVGKGPDDKTKGVVRRDSGTGSIEDRARFLDWTATEGGDDDE